MRSKFAPRSEVKNGPLGPKFVPRGGVKNGPLGPKFSPRGGVKNGPLGPKIVPRGGVKNGPLGPKFVPRGEVKNGPLGPKFAPRGEVKNGPLGPKFVPRGEVKYGPLATPPLIGFPVDGIEYMKRLCIYSRPKSHDYCDEWSVDNAVGIDCYCHKDGCNHGHRSGCAVISGGGSILQKSSENFFLQIFLSIYCS
jgi:hypothetical protein